MKTIVVGSFIGAILGSALVYAVTHSLKAASIGFFVCMTAMTIRVAVSHD